MTFDTPDKPHKFIINLHAERMRGFNKSYCKELFVPFSEEERADPVIAGIIARAAAEYARYLEGAFESAAREIDRLEQGITDARVTVEEAAGAYDKQAADYQEQLKECNEQKRKANAVVEDLAAKLSNAQMTIKQLKEDLEVLNAIADRVQENYDDLKKAEMILNHTISKRDTEIADARVIVEDKEDALKNANKASQISDHAIAERDTKIIELETRIIDLQSGGP